MCLCNKIVAFPEQPADILTNLVNALSASSIDSTGKIKQLCACEGLSSHIIKAFLTLVLLRGEWSTSLSGRFTFREEPLDAHLIRGWVGTRTGLDCFSEGKNLLPLPII